MIFVYYIIMSWYCEILWRFVVLSHIGPPWPPQVDHQQSWMTLDDILSASFRSASFRQTLWLAIRSTWSMSHRYRLHEFCQATSNIVSSRGTSIRRSNNPKHHMPQRPYWHRWCSRCIKALLHHVQLVMVRLCQTVLISPQPSKDSWSRFLSHIGKDIHKPYHKPLYKCPVYSKTSFWKA